MEKEDQEHEKIIHMEFDMNDDVEEQLKNASDVKVERKVQVRKRWYTTLQPRPTLNLYFSP